MSSSCTFVSVFHYYPSWGVRHLAWKHVHVGGHIFTSISVLVKMVFHFETQDVVNMQNKFETGSVWIWKLSQQVNHVNTACIHGGSQTTGTMDNWYHAIFDIGGQLGPSIYVKVDNWYHQLFPEWTTGTMPFFPEWTTGTISYITQILVPSQFDRCG